MQWLEDCIKNAKKDWLQSPKTIHQYKHEQGKKQPENKNRKKNNCKNISRDKRAKSHTRKLGHG